MLWFFAVGAAIGAALWVAVRIEPGVEPVSADDSGPGSAEKGASSPKLEADDHGHAFLELSTHPGREQRAVHLQDLVLEPDEGLILRIGLIQRGMRSAGRTSESG